jgi:hypothetical protein
LLLHSSYLPLGVPNGLIIHHAQGLPVAIIAINAHVLSSLISALNAYIDDQDCIGACHLKNYSFVITYLLEDEQELSLGMLIHLKRIYNF